MPKISLSVEPIRLQWRQSAVEMKHPPALIGAALLIAANLILDQFTVVVSPTLHISFAFLTMAVTGALYGPVVGLYAGAVNDLIAYVVNPAGPFFIGFTLSAALTGCLYGQFLYKRKLRWWRAALTQLAVTVMINLCLNTLWLSLLYHKAAPALLAARLLKNALMLPIEIALMLAVLGALTKALSAVRLRQ